jgi:hypothetical protein
MKQRCILLLFTTILAGCGNPPALDIHIPDTLDPEIKQLVTMSWPKIKQLCQGLDKHADALKFKGIQNNYNISVVFNIPDTSTSIPDHYMAGGHTCYFDISRDGKRLIIAKEGCKAVCLDRALKDDELASQGDLVLPLIEEAEVETPANTTHKKEMTRPEARKLAAESLAYIKQFQAPLGDHAVMNQEALNHVFYSPEYKALIEHWPPPFSGQEEADKFGSCHELLVSAFTYATAQNQFATNHLEEKIVIPLREQYKKDTKACHKQVAMNDAQFKAEEAAANAELKKKFGDRECLAVLNLDKATGKIIEMPKPNHCKK